MLRCRSCPALRRSTSTIRRLNHGAWPTTEAEWHYVCQRAGAALFVCPTPGDEYRGALLDDVIIVQPARTEDATHARICHELVEHMITADNQDPVIVCAWLTSHHVASATAAGREILCQCPDPEPGDCP